MTDNTQGVALDPKAVAAAVIAHDNEENAQRGEPKAWSEPPTDDDSGEWAERLFCMEEAIRAYLSSLSAEAGDDGQGALVERARYFVENPSAWESGFDQGASDRLSEVIAAYDALRADKERVERERDEAERLKCTWFETHLAHRDANEALGKANGKLLERAMDAERRAEAAERRLSEQGQAADCDRCAGNGEIVTDWDRYRHPHDGDVGDEAVADCPDCFGVGTVPVTPPAPEPVAERARKEARELAERAGIDMLDDHDQFIDDLTETLVRFARHRKQGGA